MKLLVCGSRMMPSHLAAYVRETIRALAPTEVIQGGARGADALAKLAAEYLGIPCREVAADWDRYGRGAGPIRNQRMLELKPDRVLAFYPLAGITSGTLDMVKRAALAKISIQLCPFR